MLLGIEVEFVKTENKNSVFHVVADKKKKT